jgi:hypothetical protein
MQAFPGWNGFGFQYSVQLPFVVMGLDTHPEPPARAELVEILPLVSRGVHPTADGVSTILGRIMHPAQRARVGIFCYPSLPPEGANCGASLVILIR